MRKGVDGEWRPGSENTKCQACQRAFGLMRIRHQCSACNGHFCHQCAPYWTTLHSRITRGHEDETLVCQCLTSGEYGSRAATGGRTASLYNSAHLLNPRAMHTPRLTATGRRVRGPVLLEHNTSVPGRLGDAPTDLCSCGCSMWLRVSCFLLLLVSVLFGAHLPATVAAHVRVAACCAIHAPLCF